MNTKPLTKSYIKSRSVEVESGCWEWSGFLHATGYGELRRGKKRILAHRLSFFLWNGHWPNVCRHTCDNRKCVNPDHLLDGTLADNNRDREDRGRGRQPKGEAHGMAKLTQGKVEEVFRLRGAGATQTEIAKKVGCSQSNVSRILLGKNWVS